MKYQAYVLLGPPGSGKGTQGQMLSRIPTLVHVSIHDVFGSLELENEVARMYEDHSAGGQKMLNLVMVEMLRYHLRTLTKKGRLRPGIDTVVLDGIPANAAQAAAIRSFVNVRLVFNLWLPSHTEVMRRMREQSMTDGGTEDSSDVAIRERLRHYINDAMALIQCYRSVTRVVISMAEPIAVFRDIMRMIKGVDGDRLVEAQRRCTVGEPDTFSPIGPAEDSPADQPVPPLRFPFGPSSTRTGSFSPRRANA